MISRPHIRRVLAAGLTALLCNAAPAAAQPFVLPPGAAPPPAVITDPPRDPAHAAHMRVLHIPSGGERINGVVYSPSGVGAHPTFVLLHGLPGNEQNLDRAQAVRHPGWNVVTLH